MRIKPSGRILGAGLALLAALGAGPPEVVRARVPASKVATWFPPGSDLMVLAPEAFEALVRSATARPEVARGARALRARHSARWESGTLVGRSELTVDPAPGPGAGLLVLDPWSPALLGKGEGARLARATADGRLGLRVEPAGPRELRLDWQLRPRLGSGERSYALALPELDLSSMVLDLPSGMVPEADAGPRIGPESGPDPGRSTWRFPTARGRLALRIRDGAEDPGQAGTPRNWLEGPTRIDLDASPSNWKAEWTLDGPPGAPRRLTIDLDPGLELVDVSGPRVASFRIEPGGSGTRLAIRLEGEGAGPSPLTIRAICRPPAEGAWPVPSARPVDATWTGGRTSVRLDATRVLQGCVERSGRRIPPRAGASAGPMTLLFEPNGEPGPVAELSIRRPTADATVTVQGHFRVGDEIPRLEAALTWAVERGRALAHAADLPAGWTPDRVASGSGDAVAWHADEIPGGGLRVHMNPSPPDGEARTLTLTLTASARRTSVTGPIDLPRVRPSPGSGRVLDELWVATTGPGMALRPTLAWGLAWVDPPSPSKGGPAPPWPEDHLGDALAWRWLVDDAEASANRVRVVDRPSVDVRLDASVARGGLHLEWTLGVDAPPGRLTSIPIHLDGPLAGPPLWRSSGRGGVAVEARPMGDARRSELGLPATGSAFELVLDGPSPGRVELEARADQPWAGSGRIPLLTLPASFRFRGLVAVRVEDTTRLLAEPVGLSPVDLAEAPRGASEPAEDAPPEGEAGRRRVAMFGYREGGGRLRIETRPGELSPAGGVVREASLLSQFHPGAGLRHRLTLRVAADSARSILLTMPAGVELDRLRRDGQPAEAVPEGRGFRVPIPSPAPGRPTSAVTLEYRTGPATGATLAPSTLLPTCSLPCSSFTWEVVAPEPWGLAGIAGLTDSDPRPARPWLARLLGVGPTAWPALDRRPQGNREAILARLDRDLGDPSGSPLGEKLLRLDAGPTPLVVDRLALQAAGWGPASRINLPTGSARPAPSLEATLQSMGLAAVPIGGVVLITGRAESPQPRLDRPAASESWTTALRAASATGSDPSDRFQSVARWRGEPTARALSAGEAPERSPAPEGWRSWRLVGSGWPTPASSAQLVDERSEEGRGWLVAAVALAIGVGLRRQPGSARALAIGAALASASLAIAWGWPDPPSEATGLLRGCLAVLAAWLGRSLRGPARSSESAETTTFRRGGIPAQVATASAVLALLGLASIPSWAALEPSTPILALLPFEGAYDPSVKPDRVVMLVEDHERLRRLAVPEPAPSLPPRAWLAAATHRVGRDGPGFAAVESRYEVEVEGPGPASWTIPVGLSRDLSATVDGRVAPMTLARDGMAATVPIEGPGTHALVVRRSLPMVAVGAGGERFRLPINRAAFARVEVAPDSRGHWVEVRDAAGPVEARAGGFEGALGPAEALDVRWSSTDRPPAGGPRGAVEATVLWDARPQGDLVRLRLVHSDPDGASTIRLGLEPGLLIRRASIPDLVGVRGEGTADRPEWVAHIDPPWPRDLPIEVDVWRPIASGSAPRRLPRVVPLDARKFSGVVGFRRPGDWSGRIEPGEGAEAVPEASFAKAWRTLPEDGLTLAGAVRLGQTPELSVATGPIPLRRVVRPRVQLDVEPGRLGATIDAVLSDRQGRSFELEVGLPADFRVARVEAAGLVDWQKLTRERLRIQFDGSDAADRPIRIQGYLPAPADPALGEVRGYQSAIPWPRWPDATAEAGMLIVSSPGRFQLDLGEGVTPGPPPEPGQASRSQYKVDRPSGLGLLRWSSPKAKVGVSVRSDLTIDPARVTWTAAVECEVTGGPAESLQWNLPTAWARGAELEVDGHPSKPSAEERGEITTWRITPEPPIWGRARLVIRSRVPLRPDAPFNFPEVSPLALPGRGTLGRYDLAIANVSGRPIEVAGSPGLQAIDASQYRSDQSPAPPGTIDRAYRVTGDRWSLRVTVRGGEVHDEARVAQAQASLGLGPLGEVWGQARYDLAPRPGPFFGFQLPEEYDVPWASVDGAVAPVLRDGGGRWLVPLGERDPRRVTVCWHAPPGKEATSGGAVAWPKTRPADAPTLLSLALPRTADLAFPGEGPARLTHRGWLIERAERLSARVVDALADFDRSSRLRRGEILRDLVEFELIEREAGRDAGPRTPGIEAEEGRLRAARDAIAEAGQSGGLEDLVQEARGLVGLAPAPESTDPGDGPDPTELIRVRRVGDMAYFRVDGPDPEPAAIRWAASPTASRWADRGAVAIGSIGLAMALITARLVARPIRLPRRAALLAAGPASIAGLLLEPMGAAMLLVIAALGWLVDRPGPAGDRA